MITRDQQKIENTWKLEDIYENETLFEQEYTLVQSYCQEFKSYEGKLSDVSCLVSAIQCYEKINYYFGRVYVYANQRNHQDASNSKYQAMSAKAQLLAVELSQSTSWFEPEVLTLNNLDAPELKPYTRFLQSIIRQKDHVLDAKTEELLAKASDLASSPDDIFSMFNNADIRFEDCVDEKGNTYPLTQGTYISYMESKDRTLRKSAFDNLYKVYGQFNNSLSAMYYANCKASNFFSKEHKFENTLQSELFSNEIPYDVYDNLISTIHNHFDSMHEYVSLRKEILSYDQLHMYDFYVPLSKCDSHYTFEQAKEIVLKGLAPLGQDYLDLLQEGFDNRWIDVYENQGKRTGAYSWGCYGTHPYVLLNYNNTLNDVFTLAHEMGHALHTYYSNSNQSILDSDYRIFVAEVASTCNESLLIQYLLKESKDKDEKIYLLNYFLDQFKSTMYRQTMFAEFEKITHEMVSHNEVLTAETLNTIYLDLNKKYYGNDIVVDSQIQYEWSRIPHFYTPFYVYQYATSFAAAIAISTKILNHEDGIVEKYKTFLKGGCSQSPIDLLKICGIDMSKPDAIDQALLVFKDYIHQLEDLIHEN
ncbi:oligoendopeptidase F [Floccifex sp.]|uniref:oligoendopeptidase F n=1 Tax=Floccifex sp. TaxID=2815810 RepID=UPI002A761733|nr:oligoendopeptidase F [Floccifex sp.]MDD7281207.1 oligoendopeptidase F [Erysipelotrichaceae bacterium]MDY2958255.1 oligoendopeptidase F [Floccifex sp.]